MTLRQWAEEHPAIAALILGLAAALLLEAFLLWQLAPARRLAERHAPRLAEMEPIAARALELRRRQESGGPKFLAPDTLFSAEAVDRVARDRKIVEHVTSSSVKEEKHAGQTSELVVRLSIKGVTAQELRSFLGAVEALDPAVRVRELKVTVNREQPSMVDAEVQISAYESATATN